MQCKTCKGELVIDEIRECLVCPECHPSGAPKPKFNDGAIPDVIFEEFQIEFMRQIIKEELTLFTDSTETVIDIPEEKTDWRGDAKRLGVPVYDQELKRPRKKADVLKDIELKSQEDNNETP